MAKKARVSQKKGKAARKAKAVRKAGARAAKPLTQFLNAEVSVVMTIHDVASAFQMLAERDLLTKFIRAAKKKLGSREHSDEQLVTIGADTVNFVKEFLSKKSVHDDPIGRHIIVAKPPEASAETIAGAAGAGRRDRFRCDFGRGH